MWTGVKVSMEGFFWPAQWRHFLQRAHYTNKNIAPLLTHDEVFHLLSVYAFRSSILLGKKKRPLKRWG
jgi:hypothetical protein